MRMTDLPPAMILLLGAIVVALARGRARSVLAVAIPCVALIEAWKIIAFGAEGTLPMLGMVLQPLHVHAATPVFATVFCLIAAVSGLFSLNQPRGPEQPATLVYAAGALGVVFSGDLLTMFVFWELMCLGSTVVIFSGRQPGSAAAGLRYFALHAVGGAILLLGITLVVSQRIAAGDPQPLDFTQFGALAVNSWPSAQTAGMWLMLLGMLVNAGAPPFSPWVADAYPEGSPWGTVVLSAFTTKTAVFTLMVAFAGTEVLIYIGMFMALYGIVYALLENDMRRILAYSIVNQVGFMLVGIGIGTKLAIDGAASHAFAHVIYKSLLMMSAGSVLLATGRRKCTELGGLWRTMPVTMWCGIIGALAISSFPLTSGYTTKTMIIQAATEQAGVLAQAGVAHNHLIAVWFVLEAASAGVFLHAGIKFPWFVFFQKESGLRPPDPPWNMRAAMVILAGACIFLGVFPGVLYDILPYQAEAANFDRIVYNAEYLITTLGLLMFSALAFFVLLPMLKRTETITLDFDWVWRRFIPRIWNEVLMPVLRGLDTAQKAVLEKLPGKGMNGEPRTPFRRLGAEWAVSVPVFVITAMLIAYLVVYFLILPQAG